MVIMATTRTPVCPTAITALTTSSAAFSSERVPGSTAIMGGRVSTAVTDSMDALVITDTASKAGNTVFADGTALSAVVSTEMVSAVAQAEGSTRAADTAAWEAGSTEVALAVDTGKQETAIT